MPASRQTPVRSGARASTLPGRELLMLSGEDLLGPGYRRWPVVLRLLAENVGRTARPEDREAMLDALRQWITARTSDREIHFTPGRLLMHDTTSTPALVDIAAMRDAVAAAGGDPSALSPRLPVEVSVDHSLAVEAYARRDAPALNIREEVRRNRERYRFLKWAAGVMDTLHINPPGTGIMHTINLEQLSTVVTVEEREGRRWAAPDMMLGTDSHTPMVNGLGVLGWGIGGLEAETVMFGMPTTLKIPDVVGVRLRGALPAGVMATDLALVVTQRLRELGVTGEFVEFFGPGVGALTVGDRAVIANMAPEYGATTGYFPVDGNTLSYLGGTGRAAEQVELVREYAQAAGLWFDPASEPEYTRSIEIDLAEVSIGAAGPRRPQDHLRVEEIPAALDATGPAAASEQDGQPSGGPSGMPSFPVAIASITSCTNTTDPRLLIAAGLLARRAGALGLRPPAWVKTSLAPGSPAAVSYLRRSGLDEALSAVGFDVVGFGCATCIGNSGGLTEEVDRARRRDAVQPVAVLSGNRNFPGRVHPDLDLGLLMSPPMVIAYALAGDAHRDLTREPVASLPGGGPVWLHDLWPTPGEIDEVLAAAVSPEDFGRDFLAASRNRLWDGIEAPGSQLFPWDPDSTILRPPPFAEPGQGSLLGVYSAHPLLVLGDDVTTDHISPASAIPRDSFVADFLVERGEEREDLNVFASRRGNWEVMARGAYYASSLRNALAPDGPTAHTVHGPSGERMRVWDAAARYRAEGESVVVVAGERYGMGSSRDWAAKVQRILGVRAVLAAGFERIHRSNLIGMGILPLVVPAPWREALAALSPGDRVRVDAAPGRIAPRARIRVEILRRDGSREEFLAEAAVETAFERALLESGGVIPTILADADADADAGCGATTRDALTDPGPGGSTRPASPAST
ncbi:aconitate hydratase AcnA [Rothia sp. AR01]|uniref:Aconitate hydratase AcnA n=1 Tax=Rothia santali TaxID=2949643 RepID=A0A9X2HE70_9MICC|nr:aconitate hydratase AcnA [Rothia santali]MCP3425584.1 aconitate hydratase AcnA [Rothia santali]